MRVCSLSGNFIASDHTQCILHKSVSSRLLFDDHVPLHQHRDAKLVASMDGYYGRISAKPPFGHKSFPSGKATVSLTHCFAMAYRDPIRNFYFLVTEVRNTRGLPRHSTQSLANLGHVQLTNCQCDNSRSLCQPTASFQLLHLPNYLVFQLTIVTLYVTVAAG